MQRFLKTNERHKSATPPTASWDPPLISRKWPPLISEQLSWAIQSNKKQKTRRLLYALHFLEHNAMYFLVRQHENLDDDDDDDKLL